MKLKIYCTLCNKELKEFKIRTMNELYEYLKKYILKLNIPSLEDKEKVEILKELKCNCDYPVLNAKIEINNVKDELKVDFYLNFLKEFVNKYWNDFVTLSSFSPKFIGITPCLTKFDNYEISEKFYFTIFNRIEKEIDKNIRLIIETIEYADLIKNEKEIAKIYITYLMIVKITKNEIPEKYLKFKILKIGTNVKTVKKIPKIKYENILKLHC